MTGPESHESPLERVTGEKDVHPEEERGSDRPQERGAERDGGGASEDASGGGEPETGS